MEKFLSLEAKRIINLAEEISSKRSITYVGTESLLLAMIKSKQSVANFIFKEYNISFKKVEDIYNDLIILRKRDLYKNKYSTKLHQILITSNEARIRSNSKAINDEHLFYALLVTPNTVALKMLELLDIKHLDILNDFVELFNNDEESTKPMELSFLTNITLLAKNNKLHPFVTRQKYLDRIIKVLSKKQKNNPLLIGSAGVGKTALVEGLALYYLTANPKINIYRLELPFLMAGTKYRGDLEERLMSSLKQINNENDIIFIDEIHTILGTGNSEGSLDVANILKPMLSRSEFKCIGATTLDEYYKYIDKDKALSRRFVNVFIEEPDDDETLMILDGIRSSYEEFHNVIYTNSILEYIIKSSKVIHNRKQPDKVIDILDEVGYLGSLKEEEYINEITVDEVIFDYLGIDYHRALKSVMSELYFPVLRNFYFKYFLNVNLKKTIVNVELSNANELNYLISDINKIFNLKEEQIYNLDLLEYTESHSISNILGAPPGYIGFNSNNLMVDHILKFPISVVTVRNFNDGNLKVKNIINTLLEKGFIYDLKGRCIDFQNTIFIFISSSEVKPTIGFNSQEVNTPKISKFIDVKLHSLNNELLIINNTDLYLEKIKKLGYVINVDKELKSFITDDLIENNLETIFKSKDRISEVSFDTDNQKIIIK